LQDLGRGRIGRAHDFVGDLERRVGRTATNRESGADDPDRPLVPLAGLPAVRAVGIGCALQILGSAFVVATHQRHLGEGVVDGAGRLVEAHRAARFERAVKHRVGPRKVAHAHADLTERTENHRRYHERPERLDERDGALGLRQRLIVTMLDQRHVGLVDANAREHVVSRERDGLLFGQP
jgi:hypothetical protein